MQACVSFTVSTLTMILSIGKLNTFCGTFRNLLCFDTLFQNVFFKMLNQFYLLCGFYYAMKSSLKYFVTVE